MKLKCKECNSKLVGRSDKKFCNDYCRTSFHSKLNRDQNATIRTINAILRKNRRILALLYLDENGKWIQKEYLQMLNFNFSFYTHSLVNSSQKNTICYYDIALCEGKTGWYKIKKLKDGSSSIFQSKAKSNLFLKESATHQSTAKE